MKIISWNINGIRAVCGKGFLDWFKREDADVVCLQEIKAKEEQVSSELLNLTGYYKYFNPAEKLGYAGTAVFCKEKPISVEQGIGFDRFDQEGRVQILKFKKFVLVNFYMINGGGSEATAKKNMADKLASYDYLLGLPLLSCDKGSPSILPSILVGDFNIAHKEIDLARPKENVKKHGFTVGEREKIDKLLELGFVDSLRHLHPNEKGAYTWWTHWANARARNIGWRIDYCFVSKDLLPKLNKAFIQPKTLGSDHCPVGVDIEL